VVQTGASPSFTVEGSHGKITIPNGITFTVDGGVFNLAALIDTLPRIDGRGGVGILELTNGAVGNFAQDLETDNVLLRLDNATFNGPGILNSNNIDLRTLLRNATVTTTVTNSETIYIEGTTTFSGPSFNATGYVYGVGTLDISGVTNPVTIAGRIDPAGHYDTDPDPDTLTIAGNLVLTASSEVMIHIKQVAPGNVISDVVAVTGAATLDGQILAELHVTDTGYIPSSGDEFEVVTATSGTGVFDNDTVPLAYDTNGDGTLDGLVNLTVDYRGGNSTWLVVP
jgi:hypothetical protein